MPPRQTTNENRQQSLLQHLVNLLEGNEDVLTLGLRGSLLQPERMDRWSDVDVLLVVRDRALERFFPTLDWLAPLGSIFGYEQFTYDDHWTTRVCFADFRRLDISLTTLPEFLQAKAQLRTLFPGQSRLLISRSEAAAGALSEPTPPPLPSPPSPEEFQRIASRFWFRCAVAVVKIMRDDLLIGTHLTLELIQECCVLAMMLRDRATGTTHHRSGGTGNELVNSLPSLQTPYSARGLLEAIRESGRLFDRLAREWTDDYQLHSPDLKKYVESAEQELQHSS